MRLTRTRLALALALGCGCPGNGGGDGEDTRGSTEASDSTATSTSSAATSTETAADASTTPASTGVDSTTADEDSTDTGQPVGEGGCAGEGAALTELERTIAELPADTWWTATDTPMRAACPADLDAYHCSSVVSAWSGGTWDPVHRQLLVFGGGHADSPDNTLYAFDLGTLGWSRLTERSSSDLMNADPLPDGQPVSRHSYDGIQYLAHAERLFVWGGSRWMDGNGTAATWTFDHEGGWTEMQATPQPGAGSYSHATAYDPESGNVLAHLGDSLQRYDLEADAWTLVEDYGFAPYWPRYAIGGDKRGAIDSSRGLLFVFGAGIYLVYDIANDAHVTDDWITEGGSSFDNSDVVGGYPEQQIVTGGGEVIEAPAPGVDYDRAADALVAFVGGAPWRLDLASKTWTTGSADGAPPDVPNSGGTFGRWRYIARVNAFVLVNSVDADVVFYKHTAGCGP
jgi:hypothetical protein